MLRADPRMAPKLSRHNIALLLAGLSLLLVGAACGALALHGMASPSLSLVWLGRVLRWAGVLVLAGFAISRRSLTPWIFLAMVAGAELGFDAPAAAAQTRVFSDIFLRLIKTIVAPLILSTLVVGIAGHGDLKGVGRMGIKSLVYFEVVTTFALAIGLVAINVSRAGVGLRLAPPPSAASAQSPAAPAPQAPASQVPARTPNTALPAPPPTTALTAPPPTTALTAPPPTTALTAPPPTRWDDFLLHIFPENLAKSIAEGQILQVAVFAVFFGIALATLEESKRAPVLHFCASFSEVMFRFTNVVMYFAPVGVGAAMAYTVGHMGLGVLLDLGKLLLTLYGALLAFGVLVLLPAALLFRVPVGRFLAAVAEPATIAFATSTSEAALPRAMEAMEALGVPRRIVAFVIPAGYSFNLDGSTLYLAVASIFVAQAAGIRMPMGQQLLMMGTLILTSKGVAGVPRATLVVLLATAATFHLPTEPIFILLGVDALADMARTTVNVVGNCLASVVIARWEGVFRAENPSDTVLAGAND